jgi:hypothetical protein
MTEQTAQASPTQTFANDSLQCLLIDADLQRQQEYDAERLEYRALLFRDKPQPNDGRRLLVLARSLEIPLEDVKRDIRRCREEMDHRKLIESLSTQIGDLSQQAAELEARRNSIAAMAGQEPALQRAAEAGFVASIWFNSEISPAKREKVAQDYVRCRGYTLSPAGGWRPPGVVDRFGGIELRAAVKQQLAEDFAGIGEAIDLQLSARSWAIVTGKATPEPTPVPTPAPHELQRQQDGGAPPPAG